MYRAHGHDKNRILDGISIIYILMSVHDLYKSLFLHTDLIEGYYDNFDRDRTSSFDERMCIFRFFLNS